MIDLFTFELEYSPTQAKNVIHSLPSKTKFLQLCKTSEKNSYFYGQLLLKIQTGVKKNKNIRRIRTTLRQKNTSNKELNNIINYNLRSKDCAKSHEIIRRIVILNDTKRDGGTMNAYLDQNKNIQTQSILQNRLQIMHQLQQYQLEPDQLDESLVSLPPINDLLNQMLDTAPWVQELRGHTKKQSKYKKRKKYEKIIEEFIKKGWNLANTEITESYQMDDEQSLTTEQIDIDDTEEEQLFITELKDNNEVDDEI